MKTVVVHRYTTSCYSVAQPPGFCDFLRGTCALHQLSKMMNFKLIVDFSCHPLKDFIIPLSDTVPPKDSYVFESFNTCMLDMPYLSTIKDGETCCVNCNNYPDGYRPTGFQGGIDQETKQFVKKSIQPKDNVKILISNLKSSLGINEKTATLHIRGGDADMKNDIEIPANLLEYIKNVIFPLNGNNVLVISDNKHIKNKLCDMFGFKKTECQPVHLGECKDSDPENVGNTFTEFMLMSESNKIYQWSIYYGSGFSELCAAIYDIPLEKINITK
jgi:hypothetical protein